MHLIKNTVDIAQLLPENRSAKAVGIGYNDTTLWIAAEDEYFIKADATSINIILNSKVWDAPGIMIPLFVLNQADTTICKDW